MTLVPVMQILIIGCQQLLLLGYANEVGEAFRSIVHRYVVNASYAVASLYVLADTADKTNKRYIKENKMDASVLKTAGDTLVWQALASVVIPGFTINRLCALSMLGLKRTKLTPMTAKWTTTAIGLSCIPFIVSPIDRFVDWFLDSTLRPLFSIPRKLGD